MSTYTNLSMVGGRLSGRYCPTLSHCALKHFNALHRESMRYLNVFTTHRCVARCVTGLSQATFLCHLIKFKVLRFFFLFSFRLEVLSVLFLFSPPSLYCARIIQRARKNGLTLTHNLRSRS